MEDPRLWRCTWWVNGFILVCPHLGERPEVSELVQRVFAICQPEHKVIIARQVNRQRAWEESWAVKRLDCTIHLSVFLSDPFIPPSFSAFVYIHGKIYFPNSLAKFRSFSEMGDIRENNRRAERMEKLGYFFPSSFVWEDIPPAPFWWPLLPSSQILPGRPAAASVSSPWPWLLESLTPALALQPLGSSPPHLWLP